MTVLRKLVAAAVLVAAAAVLQPGSPARAAAGAGLAAMPAPDLVLSPGAAKVEKAGHRRPRRYYRRRPGVYFYYGPGWRPGPRYYAPRPRYRAALPRAHYNWCFRRYRSYRAGDNTFQPYNGPRRQCISPYVR